VVLTGYSLGAAAATIHAAALTKRLNVTGNRVKSIVFGVPPMFVRNDMNEVPEAFVQNNLNMIVFPDSDPVCGIPNCAVGGPIGIRAASLQ